MRLIDSDVVIFHILLDRGMSEIKKLLLIEDIKKIPTSCPSWFCQHCVHYPKEQISCPCDGLVTPEDFGEKGWKKKNAVD